MIVSERGFTNPVNDIAWRQQDPSKLFKYFISIYHMEKGNRKTKLLTYSLKPLLPQVMLYSPNRGRAVHLPLLRLLLSDP